MSIPILLILMVLFLLTVTLHEYAHGRVAYWMGDETAKRAGRLTLNPLKHIDPFWTLILPAGLLFLGLPAIGMAKPVPVNFLNLKPFRLGMICVALAGPLANILLAIIFSWCFFLSTSMSFIFLIAAYFNLGLALFNLLPIPPLDGSRIVMGLLPPQQMLSFMKLERFGFLIIIVMIYMGMIRRILIPAINIGAAALGLPQF